jgi:hypothetical protein
LDAQLKNKKGFDSKTDEKILKYKNELSKKDKTIQEEHNKTQKLHQEFNKANVS